MFINQPSHLKHTLSTITKLDFASWVEILALPSRYTNHVYTLKPDPLFKPQMGDILIAQKLYSTNMRLL